MFTSSGYVMHWSDAKVQHNYVDWLKLTAFPVHWSKCPSQTLVIRFHLWILPWCDYSQPSCDKVTPSLNFSAFLLFFYLAICPQQLSAATYTPAGWDWENVCCWQQLNWRMVLALLLPHPIITPKFNKHFLPPSVPVGGCVETWERFQCGGMSEWICSDWLNYNVQFKNLCRDAVWLLSELVHLWWPL